ncbi:hypothetical protein HKX48_008891 [Thoreauomyces humboldtii]|nr:hypothetical protein HKX48_008891 [Thoreauomyces humboldtii]
MAVENAESPGHFHHHQQMQAKKALAHAQSQKHTTTFASAASPIDGAAAQSPTIPAPGQHDVWSGFYKKALKERQNQLRLVFPGLFPPNIASPAAAAGPAVNELTRTPSPSSDSEGSSDESGDGAPLGDRGNTLFPLNGLDENVADNMVENCVGTLGLPVGIGLNFTINSVPTVVPMCVEEPSVVAAASGAAKTISAFGGGFTASTSERNIIYAQIQVLGIPESEFDDAMEQVTIRKEEIVALGNQFCENMRTRGGGVVGMDVRKVTKERTQSALRPNEVRRKQAFSSWLVVHLHVDVCDAMGANCCSAVAEGTAPLIASLTGGTIGLKIVSNMCVERMAKAGFCMPVDKLGYKGIAGEEVAFRLVEANDWARADPFRAATHNKGIMNGIDAVALATGQDWRAIEAAGHAWNGVRAEQYRPFTDYWVEEDASGRRFLHGELELPMPVATKGGVLKTNPVYSYTLGLLNNPDSKGLGMVHVAVGLAQNFAALRALCTEGIQRGHMSLHARNIAIAAGAPPHAIAECVTFMVETGRFNRNAVKEYLTAHEVLHEIRLNASFADLSSVMTNGSLVTGHEAGKNGRAPVIAVTPDEPPPSLFYFEAPESQATRVPGTDGRVTLNVAFQTLGSKPVHIELLPNVPSNKITRQLFGEKGHAWLSELPDVLESLRITTVRPERSNAVLGRKLKLLSVLLNLVIRRLMIAYPVETARFVKRISRSRSSSNLENIPNADGSINSPKLVGGSGIFRHRVLLDVDLKHISPADMDSHLAIGFPLVLALWQVFEFRVQQWVGQPVLARALIDEQWRVVLALTNAPLASPTSHSHRRHSSSHAHRNNHHQHTPGTEAEPTPAELFQKAVETHSKRFQSTVFVLCDAITFPERDVDSQLVQVLAEIGATLEWNHVIAHDLSPSRLARDVRDVAAGSATCSTDGGLATGVVNSFFLYLSLVRGVDNVQRYLADKLAALSATNDEQLMREAFRDDSTAFLECVVGDRRRRLETSSQTSSSPLDLSSSFLDWERVGDALRLFGRYYGTEAVMGPRE